ncbi:MAG: CHAT domain-containing protein [Pedobacter sp.]|nr:MAG: CHAT domain-containing protein [Pedobacter sp.]
MYGGIDYGVKNNKPGVQTFNPLPGTLTEAEKISDMFSKNLPATAIQVKTGLTATENSIKAFSGNSPAVIHLATHGFYMPSGNDDGERAGDPLLRCGLVFAGANSNNTVNENEGLLTGYEIAQLDLRSV